MGAGITVGKRRMQLHCVSACVYVSVYILVEFISITY